MAIGVRSQNNVNIFVDNHNRLCFHFFFFLIFIGQGKIIYKMQVKTLSLSGLLCAQYLCSKNIYANTY